MEYLKDDVDYLPDSDFDKAAARVFDKIDHGKAGFLTLSKFFDLIETLVDFFHSEDQTVHLPKIDPNQCGYLDIFTFVR